MPVILSDDGTLDTVLECTDCGKQFRFSYMPGREDGDMQAYDAFVEDCIEAAEDEHICGYDEDD